MICDYCKALIMAGNSSAAWWTDWRFWTLEGGLFTAFVCFLIIARRWPR